MSNVDKTFCASPDCQNKCGRKMNETERKFVRGHPWYPISYGYFCGEPTSIDINPDMTSKDINKASD